MAECLTKDAILAADDIKTERVHVPEWNGDVYVRSLSGTARDAFENATAAARRTGTLDVRLLMVRYLVLTICDEKGGAMFTDGDLVKLNEKSAGALQRVFNAAQSMNGMTDEDVEELLGNSESDPSEGSGSS